MKQLPTVFVAICVCFLSVSALSGADWCDKGTTIYGFERVLSGDATFGQIVAAAGDVDNDGYPDILIGTTRSSFSTNATASVFSGLTGELIRTYYDNNNTLYATSGFGDYNNDGYDDILANGVVYSGLTGDTLMNFGSLFRRAIGVGDANDDGKYDIVLPNYVYSNSLGRVDLISGANGDTLQSWTGSQTGGHFGLAVAAGDINNDGYPDIIIGEPNFDYFGLDRGCVFVYSGNDGSELFYQVGDSAQHEFGYHVASAGDLNNDSCTDILVAGQSRDSDAPVRVWAYSGQTGDSLFVVFGRSYIDNFGNSMSGIGDVSNDGHGDFAVGAFRYDNNKGKVYVYSGANGRLLTELYDRYEENKNLGTSVAGLGDIDGDGVSDYAVGARWAVAPEDPTNDTKKRGAVYVYQCAFPSLDCQSYNDFDGDIWSNICDNCKWFENISQEDSDGDGIGDLCEETNTLPVGGNRGIWFPEINWDWSGSHPQLTFDTVLAEGTLQFDLIPLVQYSDGINEIPPQGPIQYTFSTSAIYAGLITVKLPYLDTSLTTAQEEDLQMFEQIDGIWRNITSSPANTLHNSIVGETYTLGNFVIGRCEDTPDEDGDGIGDLCDNCPYGYNPNQEDADSNGVGDLCESSQPVQAGGNSDVTVAAAGGTVALSFDMVDQGGDVDVAISVNGPASGADFALFPADPPRYYEISTDALYTGNISIILNYDDAGMTAEEESRLGLWHFEGNEWVDITVERNSADNYVRGLASSLSPFTIGLAVSPSDVDDQFSGGQELPRDFTLNQNYPNPFNPQTTVEYSLPARAHVSVEVFNLIGQKVRTLVDEVKPAGQYQVIWDGHNSNGQSVSSGIYFYRLQADNYVATKKMVLLK